MSRCATLEISSFFFHCFFHFAANGFVLLLHADRSIDRSIHPSIVSTMASFFTGDPWINLISAFPSPPKLSPLLEPSSSSSDTELSVLSFCKKVSDAFCTFSQPIKRHPLSCEGTPTEESCGIHPNVCSWISEEDEPIIGFGDALLPLPLTISSSSEVKYLSPIPSETSNDPKDSAAFLSPSHQDRMPFLQQQSLVNGLKQLTPQIPSTPSSTVALGLIEESLSLRDSQARTSPIALPEGWQMIRSQMTGGFFFYCQQRRLCTWSPPYVLPLDTIPEVISPSSPCTRGPKTHTNPGAGSHSPRWSHQPIDSVGTQKSYPPLSWSDQHSLTLFILHFLLQPAEPKKRNKKWWPKKKDLPSELVPNGKTAISFLQEYCILVFKSSPRYENSTQGKSSALLPFFSAHEIVTQLSCAP